MSQKTNRPKSDIIQQFWGENMPDCKNDQDAYRWSMTEFLTTQDNIVTINGQSCKLKMTRD